MQTLLLLALLATSTVYGQDCILTVPANPLTSSGLATPYIVTTAATSALPCSQLIQNAAVFVEATVVDSVTGVLGVYQPLVVDSVGQVAAAPIKPVLAATAVVGIWFGANGNSLTLQNNNNGAGTSLTTGNCVNGIAGSIFGQFAYCNAPVFFAAVNSLIATKVITIPPLANTFHGVPCPTTRSFAVVDQDQSDNVLTTYLVTATATPKVAQDTLANRAALTVLTTIGNGSDNRLLDAFFDPACGCAPFTAPSLMEAGVQLPSLALNEIQASLDNQAIAPSGHAMTLVAGAPNLQKLNAFRLGVNQPTETALNSPADTLAYCQQMAAAAGPFFALHSTELTASPTPMATVGNNLFTFLAARFAASWVNLKCAGTSPITVTTDATGAAVATNVNAAFGSSSSSSGIGSGMIPADTALIVGGYAVGAMILLTIIYRVYLKSRATAAL